MKRTIVEGFQVRWINPETCEKCGQEVRVGDWPYCPHGDARNFGDAPLTPYWDEHISPEGAEIRTRGERRRLMAKNGLDYHDVSRKKRGKVYVCLGGK